MATLATTEGTAEALLLQVTDRLKLKVPEFTPANCLIVDEPIPPTAYFAQGNLACTVCLLDGQFDTLLWGGGGPMELTEHSELVVTVLTNPRIDKPPGAQVALLNPKLGLLTKLKPDVLRALLVDDDRAEQLQPWVPLRDNGKPFLRDYGLTPGSCKGPARIPGLDEWIGFSLHFGLSFDWELARIVPPV